MVRTLLKGCKIPSDVGGILAGTCGKGTQTKNVSAKKTLKQKIVERGYLNRGQCDQIGRFLKVNGCKFSYKIGPDIWQLFGLS